MNHMAAKKINPFVDEGEGEGDAEPVIKDTVIDLEDDDDDPIDTVTAKAPSRDEKRKSRSWMNKEEKAQLERERDEARLAAQQAYTQAQQASTYAQQAVQYASQGQGRQQQSDPIDNAAALLDRERKVLNQEYQNRYAEAGRRPITQEEQNSFEQRAQEIERRNTQIEVARALRSSGVGQQSPQNTQAEVLRTMIAQKYPEASQHQAALVWADGVQKQLVAMGRQPYSMDTIDEAMTSAEKQFKLGKFKNGVPHTPAPGMREKLSGSPRGGGSGNEQSPDGQVVMKPWMRKLANASHGHIKDEGKRYKAWFRDQQKQSDD